MKTVFYAFKSHIKVSRFVKELVKEIAIEMRLDNSGTYSGLISIEVLQMGLLIIQRLAINDFCLKY